MRRIISQARGPRLMNSDLSATRIDERRVTALPTSVPLEVWLVTWGSLWGVPDLSSRVQIQFSSRIRRSLGRCTPRAGVIRLNPTLRDVSQEILREVVCHEAAHVAVWMLHGGRVRPHGPEWKEKIRGAGYESRVRWPAGSIPVASRGSRHRSIEYVHLCPTCGSHWIAKRVVSAWRCSTCRAEGLEGRLEVTSRPTAKTDLR